MLLSVFMFSPLRSAAQVEYQKSKPQHESLETWRVVKKTAKPFDICH